MKNDDINVRRLLRHVEATMGRKPRTPADFDALAECVYRRTGRTIGVSTLKRIWGYVNSSHGTSISTLSILARCAGYADWDAFLLYAPEDEELPDTSGFGGNALVACSTLPVNAILSILWSPGKRCEVRKIAEPDLFRVLDSSNIKLLPGDTGHINSLQVGHALSMTGCRRDSLPMGNYTGATRAGIQSIHIHD